MPAAYQLWQLRGVTNATDYTCKSAGQQHVFQSEPAAALPKAMYLASSVSAMPERATVPSLLQLFGSRSIRAGPSR